MKLNTSNSSLFALSSLFLLGSSLPFFPRKVALEALVPRATYSVVAVDGGAAATGDNQAASTIIQTIVHTSPPETKTIVETDTLPPVTDYVVTTKTIDGPDTKKTVVVTLSPSTATATATKYSIINVNSPPVTVSVQAPMPSSTSSSATSSTTVPSSSKSSTSSSSSVLPTSTSTTSSSQATSAGARFSAGTQTYKFTTTSAPISSTKTYDDGLWHTNYPSWSNSTAATAVKRARTTPVV